METPVLSQSQRSKALSGNKSKQKKKSTKICDVLTNFTSRSSIKLSEEDGIVFEEKLSEFFQFTLRAKPKWNEMKLIPKEKRAKFRKTLCKSKNPLMVNLIFGINAVTRAIESECCSIVLLSNDINPEIMTKHIYEACDIYKIPLFEIPDLRKVSLKCFGFPTITMAFKNIADDSVLLSLKEFLVSIAPKTINKHSRKNINETVDTSILATTSAQTSNKESHVRVIENQALYLFRENKQTRSFVPSKSLSNKKQLIDQEVNSIMNYIELGSNNNLDINNDDEQLYKNLKVKRIRPNPNRLKGKKKL